MCYSQQKNREENKFSSRVEVRFVTPKKSGAVNSAIGLVPFLFRCFFLCCFLFSHRLIPPFQSATRGTGEELGMTSLNAFSNRHIFFVKHFSCRFYKNFYELARDDFFLRAQNSPSLTVSQDNRHPIQLAIHSRIRAAHVVRDYDVAIP